MKKFIINNKGKRINAVKWDTKVKKPKGIVVIVHGMAEHISRYNHLAFELTNKDYVVYGLEVIGHGSTINDKEIKGHWENGDFEQNVDNIQTLVNFAKKENPKIKVFLLGHSLGSFLSKVYITEHSKDIDGVILSGTTHSTPLMKIGALISRLYPKKSNKLPSPFMHKLSFESFDKKFSTPQNTKNNWLSSDSKEVEKYNNDKLCGFVCTVGFYKEFTKNIVKMDKKYKVNKIRKDLPIYLIAGSDDPVSNFAKGVKKQYQLYQKLGIKNTEIKIYEKHRHEMLNELNKQEVMKDIINFIDLRA